MGYMRIIAKCYFSYLADEKTGLEAKIREAEKGFMLEVMVSTGS